MRLPAADFHNDPRPGNCPLDLTDDLTGYFMIPVFIDILHVAPSFAGSPDSSISRNDPSPPGIE
jgi:hypothetical protein